MRELVCVAVLVACSSSQESPDVRPDADPMPDATAVACKPLARPAPVTYPPRADGLAPLDSVPIPIPIGDIVDFDAAARLGKILFWDTQVGGDGQTACASCHASAGADHRRMNTMAPGPNKLFESNGVTGPGQMASDANTTADDRLGSQGVSAGVFTALASDPATAADQCTASADPIYGAMRQVTDRNTPTVAGAVFFRELFWDGRANHVFNGVDPFGKTGNAGTPRIELANGAALSQSVGPANNAVEMACGGRGFDGPAGLGAKLLARPPLQHQRVAPDDSALGCMSASPATGLVCGGTACTYRELIAAAFGDALAADAENQFARIWGQAIAAYESILIPDQTPLDKFLRGDPAALTARQQTGLAIFTSTGTNGEAEGNCIACHAGPELSDATVGFATEHGLVNVDGGDQGFHHIGVRPTSAIRSEDLGRASLGPNGVAFSVSGSSVDRGAFKTPQLRNVKLTAPYFHNGGKATLQAIVDFYAQGGDFANPASELKAIVFTATEQTALIDFLENGLTDCRLERTAAPFDHPSIAIPNGAVLDAVGEAGTGACP